MRTFLPLGVLLVASIGAQNNILTAIGTTAVQKPIGCKDNLSVERTYTGWYVKNLDTHTSHFIQKSDVDKQIRNISPEQFARMIASGKGYVALNTCHDGSYTLHHRMRLKGGGPVTANILFWTTKGMCWGTVAAGAASGAGAVGSAAASGAALASGGLGAAGPAAAATSTAIGQAGAGAAAAEATAAATSASAGFGGLVGAIESASWGAAAVGMSLPLP